MMLWSVMIFLCTIFSQTSLTSILTGENAARNLSILILVFVLITLQLFSCRYNYLVLWS